jgi:pyruvate dehydrogenase E2 component (dihydrolipoamide acetyltransferase)
VGNFLMPSLGADMDEGTLVEWLVKPGDEVRKGQVIAVVDTAKAAIEVESFATGKIERLVVEPGETVPVGTVLATIADGVAGKVRASGKAVAARAAAEAKAEAKRGAAAEATGGGAGRPHAPRSDTWSPLVRHLADELGVDLERVRGTGRGGAVRRADITGAARPAPSGRREARRSPGALARLRVTPRARRIASDLGVDLTHVAGSGPDGAIREADVRRVIRRQAARPLAVGRPEEVAPTEVPARAAPAPGRSDTEPARPAEAMSATHARLLAMRQVTARLMAKSKREIPHYYLSETIDMTRATAWMNERNRELEVSERLVPAALLLKAAAEAARRVPALNGFWTDDRFVAGDGVHVGVAISLRGGGLVTPAIRDAADLTPVELMARLRELVGRARAGRLRGSELTDATITVTNLGDQGVEVVYGVIYPPQVALVGFGKVKERPVAAAGLVGARPVVTATLAADHRATDGYTGARFLAELSDLLQRPEEM